jgi:hypothetical protein
MKDSNEYGAQLKKMINRLQRSGGRAVEPEILDVTSELILGCLSEYNTENKARAALNKLRNHFVDINELRVSKSSEVIKVIGKNTVEARPTAERILQVLRQAFTQKHTMDLESLHQLGKREAKTFFESMEGITPYVVARVMMRGLDGHAFPLHESMLKMLRAEEVVDPQASPEEVQGFLERQITSARIHKVYTLLRRHTDHFKGDKSLSTKAAKKAKKKTSTKKKKKTASK